MKSHTIIGTAGHIDHGKTALIRALTGIDTDRLKEEKERGITIDIGFAYWKESVTIIDVPGHERFIRNMVAGVSTVDFFILVIAADDGIMPQTTEHLDILRFFNITNGIVVINKIDLVDEEWLSLIHDEVVRMLDRYGMKDFPIVQVSAVKGTNIGTLKSILEKKISDIIEQSSSKPFRLFVDRSFTIKGFGTVVTGTVLSGELRKGDEVFVIPSEKTIKVRGLQSHTTTVEKMGMGNRAAINLQGIEKNEINRGDMLVHSDSAFPVSEFTGIMHTVSKIPLKITNRSKVHVYVGTAERFGRLIWYEKKAQLVENDSYHVRIRLDSAIGAAADDVFLIRSHSPVFTLAGGKISDVDPPRVLHKAEEWQRYFDQVTSTQLNERILHILRHSRQRLVSLRYIAQRLFEALPEVGNRTDILVNAGKIRSAEIKGDKYFIHHDIFNSMADSVYQYITEFHKKTPQREGCNRQEIIHALRWKWLPEELVEMLLQFLVNQKKIHKHENHYARTDFKIKMSQDIDQAMTKILNILQSARFEPPAPEQISENFEIPLAELTTLLHKLVKDNRIIRITPHIYVHGQHWLELLEFLRDYFKDNKEMPVSALKEFIHTTRKYAIPLFEFLDSQGYTHRDGDVRQKGAALQ